MQDSSDRFGRWALRSRINIFMRLERDTYFGVVCKPRAVYRMTIIVEMQNINVISNSSGVKFCRAGILPFWVLDNIQKSRASITPGQTEFRQSEKMSLI